MRALWLEGDLSLRSDLPRPVAGPGEALVRVRLAGICGTDLAVTRGYVPFNGVLGHEFVGEIVAAADAPERVGERVVGEINVTCGVCAACAAGRGTHCSNRRVLGIRGLDGAFAEYLRLPLSNLHPVPAQVPDEAAVLTEPLAAALRIRAQVDVDASQRVLVIGAGRLGQLAARVLALGGCELLVVARHERQRRALEAAGLRWIDEAAVAAARADMVVEATGAPGGFALARRAVRPGGVICLKSTYRGGPEVDLSSLVVDEVTLLGSRCGPFPPALRLLAQGLIDPSPLIDARYPLGRAAEAMAHAARPGAIKVLLTCADAR
jgi:threonine dehydrogenase-like Zn-dependent dehydrogenase